MSGYISGNGFLLSLPIEMATSSPVFSTPGIGFSRVELIQEKIVVFAPIPRTSVSNAAAVNPGAAANCRRLYRTSCHKVVISLLPRKPDSILAECNCVSNAAGPQPYVSGHGTLVSAML